MYNNFAKIIINYYKKKLKLQKRAKVSYFQYE